MKIVRLLLLPIVPVYLVVTKFRNWLFNKGLMESKAYDFPVICIGNLSTGGTGKTPMTEYLVRLLNNDSKIATLSRGYGRSTKGFIELNSNSSPEEVGDEPFQLYSKFKDQVYVAVDEKRTHGIEKLRESHPDLDVVILDDAYQHRSVKAGFNILLTSYSKLYVNDFCLPTGNLRESVSGADRADVIMVTKCPNDISEEEQLKITTLLKPKHYQKVYFSYIDYSDQIISKSESIHLNTLKDSKFYLVTGIANSKPLVSYLKSLGLNFEHLNFKDHHNFTKNEIESMKSRGLILTTEKDYTRLKPHFNANEVLFYLPIEIVISDHMGFNKQLFDFVKSY